MTQLLAADIWRRYQVAGVPASGPRSPNKDEIVSWGTYLETLLSGSIAGLVYSTGAALQADLAHPANSSAVVIGDPLTSNNGFFMKAGGSGGGVWTRVGDLPYDIITLTATGGTANAITASLLPQVPTTPGNKLYIFTPVANNTSDTTINGSQIQTSLSQPLPANALVTGTPVLMIWSVNHYQLLFPLPQDLSGIVTFGTAGGTANAITAVASSIPVAPTNKLYLLTPAVNNTGATTLNGITVKNALNAALSADELVGGVPVLMTTDGTTYRLLISLPVATSGVVTAAAASATAAANSATAAASSASALANQVRRYDTRAQAIAATIPVGVAAVIVTRHATGYPLAPATYIPGTNTGPMNFQEAGGHYWELDLTSDEVRLEWWGVKLDGVNIDSTPVNACFTDVIAKGGRKIKWGPGTIKATARMAYVTGATLFTPGLYFEGAGENLSYIDNQVANNACLYTAGSNFQLGGRIKGFSIITTAAQVASHGIEHKATYDCSIEDVYVKGLTGAAYRITCLLGDADAANHVQYLRCKASSCLVGFDSNFASGVVQVSFTELNKCSVDQCTTGWNFIGLQGSMINTWFTQCTTALKFTNNATSNAQFTSLFSSFENNIKAIQCDSLQGGTFVQTEFASGDIYGLSPTTVVLAAAINVEFTGSRIRVSSTNNVLWTLGASSACNKIRNSMYQTYDLATQTRYSVDPASYGNMIDDASASLQRGSTNGTVGITCANGVNHDVVLPLDGAMFSIASAGSAFSVGGFTRGFDGRQLILKNTSGQTMTILSDDASSTAANRIWTEGLANVTVGIQGITRFVYDGGSSRWHFCGKG